MRELSVAMVAAMPYPTAKASSIRVGNMVRALVAEHDDVRVKVFAYAGSGEMPSHPRIEPHLVGGFDTEQARYYHWSNKIVVDVKLVRAMLRQRKAIDVIHCHTIEGLGIALAFKWLGFRRVPICVDVHGPIVSELVHYRMIPNWRPAIAAAAWLVKLALRRVDHVFVSNEGLEDLLADRVSPERISVVFDYVDLDVFARDRIDAERVADLCSRYKSRGERIVTYLGMFKDYQGVDYLIRAFAALAPQDPDLRLLLVGDGPCRAEYEEIIRDAGIDERVIMPGLVAHQDVLHWLAVSDVVVSPRVDNRITKAGFVSQMPEYMAMGKLAVATRVSGCPYLLRDGAGILVAPNDEAALREGIRRALALSPAEAAAMVAQAATNLGEFNWRHGIKEVNRVYRALTGVPSGEGVAEDPHSHRHAT